MSLEQAKIQMKIMLEGTLSKHSLPETPTEEQKTYNKKAETVHLQ